jgi:hypothetical protein
MGKTNPGHRDLMKKRKAAKKAAKEAELVQRIREGNARHDAQFGSNPEIVNYYKDYIQGTGLRQSK